MNSRLPDLTEFEKALHSLEKALEQPKNEFIRDAVIQRFKYTFELSWKIARKFLTALGVESIAAPRMVIRDMGQMKWISDIDQWMIFLDQRNLTSHTYEETVAEEVYDTAKLFPNECKKLIAVLKTIQIP